MAKRLHDEHVLVTLFAIAIVTWLLLARGGSAPSPVSGAGFPGSEGVPPAEQGPLESETAHERESVPDEVEFVARDAEDQRLLDGVEVSVVDLSRRNPMQGRRELATRTTGGRSVLETSELLEISSQVKAPAVAFRLPGHEVATIPVESSRRVYAVDLAVCSDLRIQCRDLRGFPVSGAKLYISTTAFDRGPILDAFDVAEFLPAHAGAIGVGVSDQRGHASISGVQPGRYCAWVTHRSYIAADPAWQGSAWLEVDETRLEIVCQMAPLVAVWAVSSREGVARATFRNTDKRVKSPHDLYLCLWRAAESLKKLPVHAVSQDMLSMARVAILQSEWGSEPLETTASWQGYDGKWVDAEMEYRPIDEVRVCGPKLFHPRLPYVPTTRLTIELVDKAGRPLVDVPLWLVPVRDGVPMEKMSPMSPGAVSVRSAVPITVGAGDWEIVPCKELVSKLVGKLTVKTRGEPEVRVVVSTDRMLRQVRFFGGDAEMLFPSLGFEVFSNGVSVGGQAVTGNVAAPMWLPAGQYYVKYLLGPSEKAQTLQLALSPGDEPKSVCLEPPK